jgi:hypothetical protein
MLIIKTMSDWMAWRTMKDNGTLHAITGYWLIWKTLLCFLKFCTTIYLLIQINLWNIMLCRLTISLPLTYSCRAGIKKIRIFLQGHTSRPRRGQQSLGSVERRLAWAQIKYSSIKKRAYWIFRRLKAQCLLFQIGNILVIQWLRQSNKYINHDWNDSLTKFPIV